MWLSFLKNKIRDFEIIPVVVFAGERSTCGRVKFKPPPWLCRKDNACKAWVKVANGSTPNCSALPKFHNPPKPYYVALVTDYTIFFPWPVVYSLCPPTPTFPPMESEMSAAETPVPLKVFLTGVLKGTASLEGEGTPRASLNVVGRTEGRSSLSP